MSNPCLQRLGTACLLLLATVACQHAAPPSVAAADPGANAEQLAGCFAIRGRDGERIYHELPGGAPFVRLDSGGAVVLLKVTGEPMYGANSLPAWPLWRLEPPGDSVRLTLGDGRHGSQLVLSTARLDRDTLHGRAEDYSDLLNEPTRRWRVVLTRVTCATP